MVMLIVPSSTYCHSSAVGCQCSSRSAPGSSSSMAPVMVFEMGNFVESTIHNLPPLLLTIGSWASTCHLCVRRDRDVPPSVPAGLAGGISPLAKYTSFLGKPSKVDSGRPKFLASRALGVWPIQSVMLKVPNSEK